MLTCLWYNMYMVTVYPSWDKDAHWVRVYRARIRLGWERCRQCGCANVWGTGQQLTLDHIWPRSLGGPSLMENATILCADCNNRKGDSVPRDRCSLKDEESRARRRERWSLGEVPAVPYGPWDEPGSFQPPRTPRGVRRAVLRELPEWARPVYEEEAVACAIPGWVKKVLQSKYSDESHIPFRVRALLELDSECWR